MSEEESKKALFELNLEYMKHTPKERLKLYDEYQRKRGEIRSALMKGKLEKSNTKKLGQ